MPEKLKISQTVIVEGKYDKIRLSSLLDANIIELGGFRVYNSKEKLALIRRLAQSGGIIVLTDSDSAGFKIRHYLSSAVPKEQIINVYIPKIAGKEKRKPRPGKEGVLGVEGMTTEALLNAFSKAGITAEGCVEKRERISSARLFELGLSGGEGSSELRKKLCAYYELPQLTTKALSEILPMITDDEGLVFALEKIKNE